MKALARIILRQLIFAVWLLAMWVLYCTPACMHPGRTSHRRAVRGVHPDGRHHAPPVLGSPLHPMGGRTRAIKTWAAPHTLRHGRVSSCAAMPGTAHPSRKRR